MKRKTYAALLAGLMALGQIHPVSLMAQETEEIETAAVPSLQEQKETGYFVYDLSGQFYSARANVLTPDFYVFSSARTQKEAQQLLEDLDMQEVLETWGTKVTFVTPKGNAYTSQDLMDLEEIIKQAPINNIKFIGIEEGATFLNNVAAGKVNYPSGMFLYGGQVAKDASTDQPIPVYLSNPGEGVQAFYESINNAEHDTTGLAVTITGSESSLSEAFANAWDQVLENNYRSSNNVTEFYNLPMLNDREDILEFDYQLTAAPVLEDLHVIYNEKVHQSIPGLEGSDYAWFEYIPESVLQAQEKSVPLVVSLHGNQNDPRLQGDSSGWVELAAQEGFMVVCPEYQSAEQNAFFTQEGNQNIYGTVDGMGAEGVPVWVESLLETWPQIDPSRIYVTGLSQGGALTSYLGIARSDLFAAAASVSGVNVYNDAIQEAVEAYAGNEVAYMYLCGDKDFFQMIPVDGSSQEGAKMLMDLPIWEVDENTHVYPAFTAYQKANGLETAEMDMEANSWFGLTFDSYEDGVLGDKVIHTGTLNNENGPIVRLIAMEDQAHWNYKPQAACIWEFFSQYQRDPETGALIRTAVSDAGNETSGHTGSGLIWSVLILAAGAGLVWLVLRRKKTAA